MTLYLKRDTLILSERYALTSQRAATSWPRLTDSPSVTLILTLTHMRYALLALAALAFVATADFTTCKAYGAKYDLSTDWTPGHCASEGYGLAYRELLSL